jgi:uncharacterized membrane protein
MSGNVLRMIGVVLILAGIAGLVFRVLPVHHTEQVAKVSPITATADKETDYFIPTSAAVIAVIAGGVLVAVGMRQR